MSDVRRPAWAPESIDPTRPSVARVYDYWLGGAHNFEADRVAADAALAVMPMLRQVSAANRGFLRKAVRYLLGVGVRQFLDLGSGIPTVGNVHEIVRQVDPTARVVYVDIDPVAVAHSRAILDGDQRVRVLLADVREPAEVLAAPEVRDHLDFTEPIGLLSVALLHFVADSDQPGAILAHYRDHLPSGSYLAVSHAGFDPEDRPGFDWSRTNYDSNVTPMNFRSRAEVTALFDGFDLVEPGVQRLPLWRPDSVDDLEDDADRFPGFGAVGRKP
ncbi:SAM-dependent methyltransferase [Umezawaea endophytica]|uniref:SAM-dependent methyltransferase n=1 Tax=Umezawaea endophytica TaxID=1654476 RepID=A0A9X2ZZX0_9PSEU|nr:SAM-dependent methyltransferase [Umezawaea endophytica]MCS7477929.1 SAM-dependent methyltransferase [Umezawaea endophytica]